MHQLKPNYVTDAGNKKIAVQLNIETYEKIEEVLENYGLYQLMGDSTKVEESLSLDDAKEYYKQLKKKK